ncbi:Uncharacterised protein [Bacteroides xylanisolvens]|nr:Uncharacterised protein [Bacteroides xylanisolvens]
MQHIAKGNACRFPYLLLCFSCLFFDTVEIGFRIFITYLYAVKLTKNTFLHFCCCLIGKGYSENLPVGTGIEN